MNALPLADSLDWLGTPARAGMGGTLPSAEGETDAAQRLSQAQNSFLSLRLEAALGRLAAMETLIEAERLHVRQARTALAATERALEQQRDAAVQSDRQRQQAAGEIGQLKQALHEALIEKARQTSRVATLDAALADRRAEMERLDEARVTAETQLQAARAQHSWATNALQRECLRLEEALQGERRDKLLLQRALDLARANRRALQDQLAAVPVGIAPAQSTSAALPSRAVVVPAPIAAMPFPSNLGEDAPPPALPALTEQLHAACH